MKENIQRDLGASPIPASPTTLENIQLRWAELLRGYERQLDALSQTIDKLTGPNTVVSRETEPVDPSPSNIIERFDLQLHVAESMLFRLTKYTDTLSNVI